MSVTNGSDELWVGVKCQSNTEIAGSPRNALRCSPAILWAGRGRALLTCGDFTVYQWSANSECYQHNAGVRQRVPTCVVKRATTQTIS